MRSRSGAVTLAGLEFTTAVHLTQKSNKKSQERKDTQHFSFIPLDYAVVVTVTSTVKP
jgi:hypothetical protein